VPEEPQYAPGHFTALIRAHDWPPRWQPLLKWAPKADLSAISSRNREQRLARGESGTIVNLSARSKELLRQRRADEQTMLQRLLPRRDAAR
jgi:hypothetical protein